MNVFINQKYVGNKPSDDFFSFYETSEAGITTPTLGRSLLDFNEMDHTAKAIRALNGSKWLIQGYSSSGNAMAMHEFLFNMGYSESEIRAIDLDITAYQVARQK